mmetsp:Transcript_15392/g.37810  ORF Transcript_15392/g.37810 Transcript_15392/m.37810 type:complete len:135 (-) Transcript_15392:1441-1845(-)
MVCVRIKLITWDFGDWHLRKGGASIPREKDIVRVIQERAAKLQCFSRRVEKMLKHVHSGGIPASESFAFKLVDGVPQLSQAPGDRSVATQTVGYLGDCFFDKYIRAYYMRQLYLLLLKLDEIILRRESQDAANL